MAARASNDLDTTERLRHAVLRLARVMRRQDDGELGATATSALAWIRDLGPVTLGELAVAERVAPPTMTKIVEKLEAKGFVERRTDPNDRRVTRVSATPDGTHHLQRTKERRTAWLSSRIEQLTPEQLERVGAAIEALEVLAEIDREGGQ